MKSCPTCQRQYTDETLGFCLEDGTRLVEMFDSAATWVNPPRPNTDPESTRVTSTPRHTDPTMVGFSSPGYSNPNSQNQSAQNPSYPNPSYSSPQPTAAKRRGAGIWIALGVGLVLLVIVGVAGAGLIYYSRIRAEVRVAVAVGAVAVAEAAQRVHRPQRRPPCPRSPASGKGNLRTLKAVAAKARSPSGKLAMAPSRATKAMPFPS